MNSSFSRRLVSTTGRQGPQMDDPIRLEITSLVVLFYSFESATYLSLAPCSNSPTDGAFPFPHPLISSRGKRVNLEPLGDDASIDILDQTIKKGE
jgi:hypothetical protein